MANQHFTSPIRENIEITEGHFLLTLELPYSVKRPGSGEFFMVTVRKGTDPLLKRPLSLHRLISDDTFQIVYKVVGRGTRILSERRQGEKLDILGPLGRGFEISSHIEDAILIAGGIGIAPLFALSEELISNGKSVKLFIGGRSRRDILFEKEFGSLGIEPIISTEDASYGKKGLITETLEDYLKRSGLRLAVNGSQIYACGPRPMLKKVSELAKTHAIPCYVSLEERMACGVGACLGCAVKVHPHHPPLSKGGQRGVSYGMVCKEGPVFNAEDIDWGMNRMVHTGG